MKVLGFAASNSRASINQQLVKHAATVLKAEINPDVEFKLLDLNDFEMPIYSIDRETEGGIPDAAKTFYAEIGWSDVMIISYAVHNGSYTAAFKNIFDWCSRIDSKVFQNKPMLIMSASPGAGGGASVLKIANDSAGYYGGDVRGSLSVGRFQENFDTDAGRLTDPDLAAALREQLSSVFKTPDLK